jgi:hypothetical protein
VNNLFISYDLKTPGQNYDRVIETIKKLGSWAKVQLSLWYVSSNYSAEEALNIVKQALDANDSLIVIDPTNNTAAWYGVDPKVSQHIQQHWSIRSAGYR